MFDYDDIIRESLIDAGSVWRSLDSFWRDHTVVDTRDLVHFQTYAATLLALNLRAKANHYIAAQTVPAGPPTLRQPWYPIVLFRDRLIDQSLVLYGDGYIYDSPEEIDYGEEGDPRYLYPLPPGVVSIPQICDSVTNTQVVLDRSELTLDLTTGRIIFGTDPFTLMAPKTEAATGREYVILWARNVEIDLGTAFDRTGWVLGFDQSGTNYAQAVRAVWELVLLGPSIDRYRRGLMESLGFPYANAAETVRCVETDGYRWLISTDTQTYGFTVASAAPIVDQGDQLTVGQPLSDGIAFMEAEQLASATSDQLPGLVLRVPLSSGTVAKLSFANLTAAWEYEAGRPSEWRFPVGGESDEVEQFWVDVDSACTAAGIDLATVYSLPAAVNPMQRAITDLLQNSLYVASVELASLTVTPTGFHDRARNLLPADMLLVLQQNVGTATDSVDLAAATSETVGYGYNAAVPTETISVSGSGADLEFYDLTPGVFVS